MFLGMRERSNAELKTRDYATISGERESFAPEGVVWHNTGRWIELM